MKRVFIAAAAAALGTAIYLPAAFAGDAAANPAPSQVAEADTATVLSQAPHYEWQYHYVGRHGRYEGHWALVR